MHYINCKCLYIYFLNQCARGHPVTSGRGVCVCLSGDWRVRRRVLCPYLLGGAPAIWSHVIHHWLPLISNVLTGVHTKHGCGLWMFHHIPSVPWIQNELIIGVEASQLALVVKDPSANAGDLRCRFSHWVGKIPWRRAWQPTPVSLPGESHGQGSLEGYSPWGHKRSDTTEATEHILAESIRILEELVHN